MPLVADLSHPGLSNSYIMREIGASEAAVSLSLIRAFVLELWQESEKWALGAEYFCRVLCVMTCVYQSLSVDDLA